MYFSSENGNSAFKPKLSRRWSLDNLAPNSAREGYVKDLRRQHKAVQQSHAAMDEGYPFMLTESRRVIKNFLSQKSAYFIFLYVD